MYIQRARADLLAITPHPHQENLARDDFAGVFHQQGEQFVLFAGQDKSVGIERYMFAAEIEFQVRILVPVRRVCWCLC